MRSSGSRGQRFTTGHDERNSVAFQIICALGLIGLVVGVPVALRVEGLGPPVDQLYQLVRHPSNWPLLGNRPFANGLAVKLSIAVAWIVWMWFTLCVVLELVTLVRGKVRRSTAVSRHIQTLVTCLVGATFTLLPTGKGALSLRVNVAPTASVTQHDFALQLHEGRYETLHNPFHNVSDGFLQGSHRPAASEVELTSETLRTNWEVPTDFDSSYTVQAGDTLWGIAERELGSPLEWKAIAALNQGRPQPDGRTLEGDHWIYPGWLLALPGPEGADDAITSNSPPSRPVVTTQEDVVEPETTNSVAHSEESSPRAAEPRNLDDAARAKGPDREGSPKPQLPVAPIGYGLLGAGVIAVLDRMRRAQQRHRSVGLRIALPDADLAALEGRVRTHADADAMDWIDLGVRLLFASAHRTNATVPKIVGVRVSVTTVEFILEDHEFTGAPPFPFERNERGGSWCLARDPHLLMRLKDDDMLTGMEPPLPALVTLGRDERGIVLIDLERVGSLIVSGPDAESVIQTIAVELATLPWTDQVEVIVVGFDDGVEGLERVVKVPSISCLLPKLDRRVQERTRLLALAEHQTNFGVEADSWWRRMGPLRRDL